MYNEPMIQPAEPPNVDVEGIKRGMYLLREGQVKDRPCVQLLASGASVPWALKAQEMLWHDFQVGADVWSVTSWNELRRDAMESEAPLMEGGAAREPFLVNKLGGRPGPVIAVSDFMRAVQDQIAPWVGQDFFALGADGFGFSDTRDAARRWLKIDAASIVVKALQMLARGGQIAPEAPLAAFEKYQLNEVSATVSPPVDTRRTSKG
jgi:pyruvate dehydrogenase E1 component